MPEHFIRLLCIVLPSLFVVLPALFFLLRRGKRSRIKAVFRVLSGLLFALDCAAIVLLLMIQFGSLELEWRGGYVPMPTWKKTRADMDAVVRSRAEQAKLPAAPVEAAHAGASWNGFRGLERDGQYTEMPIRTNWPATGLRLLWRQACGGGYSSFAVANGRAFTLEQRRDEEVVAAYDVETGRELWTNGWPAKFSEYHSDEGPRSTPTYDEGKVYVLGATGEARCLNATNGEVVWGKNVVKENKASLPDYGLASSPLIVGDKLILQPDAYFTNGIICYDKHDGKKLWGALSVPMGYATPVLMTVDGERQLVVCTRPDIIGLRLEDGAERWHYTWHITANERPITEPLVLGTNRLMVSAAYMTGAAAFEIDRTKDGFEARELWRNKNLKSKFASSVIWQGYIYGLDEDILVCVDAKTGERKWKDGRYGYGQLLMAGGYLVVVCANGDLALVKAAPEQWTELARVPALHGKTWNYPAISGGRILLRNGAEMACYEIGQPEERSRQVAADLNTKAAPAAANR
jgi:outer membrane protein assembly factor BamB